MGKPFWGQDGLQIGKMTSVRPMPKPCQENRRSRGSDAPRGIPTNGLAGPKELFPGRHSEAWVRNIPGNPDQSRGVPGNPDQSRNPGNPDQSRPIPTNPGNQKNTAARPRNLIRKHVFKNVQEGMENPGNLCQPETHTATSAVADNIFIRIYNILFISIAFYSY